MIPESGKTESIWMGTFNVPAFYALDSDSSCDVCIAGAGITGLTCAYMLLKSGKSVIIADDGNIGGGESSRTTAHITSVIDNRYYNIEKLHGERASLLAAESQKAGIDLIERIISENNIECDFTRLNGYLVFKPGERAGVLEMEYEAAARAGIDVKMAPSPPYSALGDYPCLEFPGQAEFHMLKYLVGLARAVISMGGRIYTKTHIKKITDGQPPIAETQNKIKITAKDIIIATNSPVSDYLAIHTKQAAYRTYVIGVRIPKDSVPHALYWDNENPYHYIRIYKQQKNDILIVGGEDHKTGQEEYTDQHFENLIKWTAQRFPMAEHVEYKWSGQVLEPFDGLSFIGKDPENPEHVYIATGDSGMGITHASYAAILLDDMINGRDNKWADLYDPKRITLKAAPEFIKEGFNTAIQYIDIITPPEYANEQEVPEGTGAILNLGKDKTAVFKDKDGKVYKFSALCPHLKCVVEWNKTENTWDCPCHGSRFEATGKVINGPALANLKPII
ncbi:MAG TPA: FAD-dependent oxidoreductase [Ignavibacteria bacterium]|nr:FAD-dependent oxidoreductase [Ignavibacteria bacterium]